MDIGDGVNMTALAWSGACVTESSDKVAGWAQQICSGDSAAGNSVCLLVSAISRLSALTGSSLL